MCSRAILWGHEPDARELFEGEIGVVIDPLGPGLLAQVVLADLLKSFPEDFVSRLTLDSMDGLELGVDLSGYLLSEFGSAMQDITILDVEMLVAASEHHNSKNHHQRFHHGDILLTIHQGVL